MLRVRVRVKFLLFYSKLAPTDPWCNMLRDFTWTGNICGGDVRWTPSLIKIQAKKRLGDKCFPVNFGDKKWENRMKRCMVPDLQHTLLFMLHKLTLAIAFICKFDWLPSSCNIKNLLEINFFSIINGISGIDESHHLH